MANVVNLGDFKKQADAEDRAAAAERGAPARRFGFGARARQAPDAAPASARTGSQRAVPDVQGRPALREGASWPEVMDWVCWPDVIPGPAQERQALRIWLGMEASESDAAPSGPRR